MATLISIDSLSDVERALCDAINERRIVSFFFRGRHRIAEPHDYGIHQGVRKLFFYQTGGETNSKGALGWRWAEYAGMSNFEVMEERFTGPRPIPSGRHHRWDLLIASVSRPEQAVVGPRGPLG